MFCEVRKNVIKVFTDYSTMHVKLNLKQLMKNNSKY